MRATIVGSDTFAGSNLAKVPLFVLAQLIGTLGLGRIVLPQTRRRTQMTITIFHNPACGTSRNTLAMIRQSGEEPQIVEYLKTPPSREDLIGLIRAMNITPRDLLRQKGTPYDELGLGDPKWSDDELIDAMLGNPILINRPIVVTPIGAKLCRPSEAVLNILPNPNIGVFTKEDGEIVTDQKGERVV